MFLGHYGVAFALKRAQPKLSLGTLFIAVTLADLLWGAFLLAGWEQVRIDPGYTAVTPLQFPDYPISHSLIGMLAWSVVGAGSTTPGPPATPAATGRRPLWSGSRSSPTSRSTWWSMSPICPSGDRTPASSASACGTTRPRRWCWSC